jgi:spore photoproduct lyase
MSSYTEFVKLKKSLASVKERKTCIVRENGRSADFVAPSLANGCGLSCSYCFVARHRTFSNPIERYTNLDDIWKSVYVHWLKLPSKTPNQCDPVYWTYDIGESTDCLLPANLEATNWMIQKYIHNSKAKPTFATKIGTHKGLQEVLQGRARIRLSLMPQVLSDTLEPGTSKITQRIKAINELIEKGYEVHVNFSPVVVVEGVEKHYIELFQELDATLNPVAKSQIKCEVIFLTHHKELHEKNLRWAPEAEQLLWRPKLQEIKTSRRGDTQVLRYEHRLKSKFVLWFKNLIQRHLPYCEIRYIF